MKSHVITRSRLKRIIGVVLIVALSLIAFLDSPEGLENTLENKLSRTVDYSVSGSAALEILSHNTSEAFSVANKRRHGRFDEDYVLVWLNPLYIRFARVWVESDASDSKFKAFFSRGNLIPRHLSLAKHRDFIDLSLQQYGRSIH